MNNYQKNIYDMETFYPGTPISNIGGFLKFETHVSYDDIYVILAEIINKNKSLRMRLSHGGHLYESKNEGSYIKKIQLSGDLEQAKSYAEKQMQIPFPDIYDSRLFDFRYIEYMDGCLFFLKLHHILGDAATIALLCKEAQAGIDALNKGEDYVCRLAPAVYREQTQKNKINAEKYFENKMKSYRFARITDKNSKDCHANRLYFESELFEKNMTDLFIAAIYIYYTKILESNQVGIGFVMANRTGTEMEMLGMFANTLPMILFFEKNDPRELRQYIRREIFLLMKYSLYTMQDMKKKNNLYKGFDISVSYRYGRFIPQMGIGTITECFNGCVDVPVRFSAEETDDKLKFSITYKKQLFDESYIMNMGYAIIEIMKQIVNNTDLADIDILTHNEKILYHEMNETETVLRYQDVIDCYKEHISKNTALIWEDTSIDGYELARRSNCVAVFVKDKNVSRVGIRMERSHEMIEAVLGILWAGAAFMILPGGGVSDADKYCDLIFEKKDVDALYQYGQCYEMLQLDYDPESTAYLIHTSGSTGRPKCIEISRKSLLTRLEWADRSFGLDGRILQKTINTFDVSIWEMLSVVYGAELYLMPAGKEKFPDKISAVMTRHEIQKIHFVPSFLQIFTRYIQLNDIRFPHLKEVYVSGEKLEKTLVHDFFNVFPGVRLINYYGPSECTIDVTSYECEAKEYDEIPIGKPAYNTKIYVLNKNCDMMPVDVKGEICVFGDLVGKGYFNGSQGGFFMLNGEKGYRTGDIGKVGADGNIYIYGRKDSQVKLHGIRLNLSNIKALIMQASHTNNIEIIKRKNQLVCFYEGEIDKEKAADEIIKKMGAYAVPSLYIKVDQLPLSDNGKIDAHALKIYLENMKWTHHQSDNKIEKVILESVNRYIKAGIDDNLFFSGLDSVSVLEIVCDLQEKGYNISFSDFYENLTIKQIARNYGYNQYFTYLKKCESTNLMVCFPYAGGEPQNYSRFADRLNCNVLGVYTSAFSEKKKIEEVVEVLIKKLPLDRYNKIFIYGQCIGCALALELAAQMNRRVDGIILVAPSMMQRIPVIGRMGKNPWRWLPESVIKHILYLSGGKNEYTENEMKKFIKDTDRFFAHELNRYHIKTQKMILIFGKKDIFSVNKNAVIKHIRERTSAQVQVYQIRNGKHFISEKNFVGLSKIVKHDFPDI